MVECHYLNTSTYILINKENSKKLLRRVKKEVPLDNRILFGLPITKKELTKINSK